MTYLEKIEHCKKAAQNYTSEELDLYIAEMGWEDWMADYCDEDHENRDLYGNELFEIYCVQKKAFLEVHQEACLQPRPRAFFG